MTQFVAVDDGGRIQWARGCPDPENFSGPPEPVPESPEGVTLYPWNERLVFTGPTETSALMWQDGAPVHVEQAGVGALKGRKNDEINVARLAANQSYFEFDGKEIACDALSMIDIQSANAEIALTRAMPANWPGYWKARDNTYASVHDVEAWTRFIQAMVARGTAHFGHAQVLKAQLAIATTPEAITAITW